MKQTQALTPEEAAEMLQVDTTTVYKLIKSGDLLAKKIGDRLYRISPKWLEWIITGYDYDIQQKREIDLQNIPKIQKLLDSVRSK